MEGRGPQGVVCGRFCTAMGAACRKESRLHRLHCLNDRVQSKGDRLENRRAKQQLWREYCAEYRPGSPEWKRARWAEYLRERMKQAVERSSDPAKWREIMRLYPNVMVACFRRDPPTEKEGDKFVFGDLVLRLQGGICVMWAVGSKVGEWVTAPWGAKGFLKPAQIPDRKADELLRWGIIHHWRRCRKRHVKPEKGGWAMADRADEGEMWHPIWPEDLPS